MERIVKKTASLLLVLLSHLLYAQEASKEIIASADGNYAGTEFVEHHVTENPGFDRFTFSLDKMLISRDSLNVYFFSELEDRFTFYINNEKVLMKNVNTKGYDGYGQDPSIAIPFPETADSFTFRLSSINHGSFEIEVSKDAPMLYIKHFMDKWYMTHSNVYRLPLKYFMRNPRH